MQRADKLLCESWNEKMWSAGEPIDPSRWRLDRPQREPATLLQLAQQARNRPPEA
jgi:hypothetical protein